MYDEAHTQSAARYAAERAADYPGCSRREWGVALKRAGVESMGFGMLIARFGNKHAGGAVAGSRVRVHVDGATAASATMLSGEGLERLQATAQAALDGAPFLVTATSAPAAPPPAGAAAPAPLLAGGFGRVVRVKRDGR